MSRISLSSASWIQVPGMIQRTLPVEVLVNSGANDNFVDTDFVKSHELPIYKLSVPEEVHAIDGTLLEVVTHRTEPLKLALSSNQEFVELFVITSPMNLVILGIPWLKRHNPHIDWATGTIRK